MSALQLNQDKFFILIKKTQYKVFFKNIFIFSFILHV